MNTVLKKSTLEIMNAPRKMKSAALTIAIAVVASVAYAMPRLEAPRASTSGAGTVRSTGGSLELVATTGNLDVENVSDGSLELVGGLILPILPTDCDEDGGVGYLDHGNLVHCLTGPATNVDSECHCFDVDASATVDLGDFAALQSVFNSASPISPIP